MKNNDIDDVNYAKALLKQYQYRYVPLFFLDACLFNAHNLLFGTTNEKSDFMDSDKTYLDLVTLLLTNTVTNALDLKFYCRLTDEVIKYNIKKIEQMEKNHKEVLWDDPVKLQKTHYYHIKEVLRDTASTYKAWVTSPQKKQLKKAKTIWQDLITILKELDCDVIPPFFSEYSDSDLDNGWHYTIPKPINSLDGLNLEDTYAKHKFYLPHNRSIIPLYIKELYLIVLTHTLLLRNIMRWLSNDWNEIKRHKDAIQNCFWGKLLTAFPRNTLTAENNYLFFEKTELNGYKKEISLFLSMLVCESGILLHKNNPQIKPCVKPHEKLLTKIPVKGHFDGTNINKFINPYLLSARLQALNHGKVIMNCPKIITNAKEAWLNKKAIS